MSNFKLIKTAAALALGASVVTSAVVPTDASAASKYKIKNGKLVIAKTGKVAKGYVTYKSTVYKDGKKLTGLKGKTYYKAGKKATGTYKGAYYYKGAKKVTTGTYNGAYYVKGVKKVTTGIYNNRYYKSGQKATGTYKGAYYVKGVKKVTTGVYNGAYYVKGFKKVTTGFYNDVLYIKGKENKELAIYKENLFDGSKLNEGLVVFEEKLFNDAKLNKGYTLYKEDLYNNEKLNTGKVVFEGKLYEDAKLSKGLVPFTEEGKKELVYNDGELANGTFEVEGKEVAYENGIEVAAKVASVEAINGTTIEVKFNKAVDKSAVAVSNDVNKVSTVVTVDGAKLTEPKLSEDGRTLTLTSDKTSYEAATVVVSPVATKADAKVKTDKFVTTITYKDTVAPTVIGTEKINHTTVKVNFSETVQTAGAWTYTDKDGVSQPVTSTNFNGNSVELSVDASKVVVGSTVTFTGVNISDKANNLITPNPVKVDFVIGAKDVVAPTISSITQIGGKKFEITFDKEVSVGTVTVGGVSASVAPKTEKATTDKTFVVTTSSVLNDPQTVTVTGFKNLDGAPMADYSKVVVFQKDTVAPTAKESKLVTLDGKEYIQLTFDKEVTEGQVKISGSQVKDYVTTTVTEVTANAEYPKTDTTKKVLLVDLTAQATLTAEDANYDLTVSSTAVKSDAEVPMTSTKVAYTYKKAEAANTEVFVTDNITVANTANPSVLTVTFAKDVDGASAILASNYKVNGQSVKAVKLTSSKVAELTLNPGQISVTGTYNVTVSDVKVKGSTKVMNTVTKTVTDMKENIAPTIKSAVLSSNDLVEGSTEIVAKTDVESKGSTKVIAGALTNVITTELTTYTVSSDGSKITNDKNADVVTVTSSAATFTQGGVEFTLSNVTADEKFTVATTAKKAAVEAKSPTITLKASEKLAPTVANGALEVYAGSTKLDLAVSGAIVIKDDTITIKLAKAVTTAELTAGLTVKPTSSNDIKDEVGNALDIATSGIQVAR